VSFAITYTSEPVLRLGQFQVFEKLCVHIGGVVLPGMNYKVRDLLVAQGMNNRSEHDDTRPCAHHNGHFPY